MMLPTAFFILSYRRQEATHNRLSYPVRILDSIERQLDSFPFYKESIVYDVEIEDVGDERVTLSIRYTYRVTNRTENDHIWTAGFTSLDRPTKVMSCKVNGEDIDLSQRKYKSGNGYEFKRKLAARWPGDQGKFPACRFRSTEAE